MYLGRGLELCKAAFGREEGTGGVAGGGGGGPWADPAGSWVDYVCHASVNTTQSPAVTIHGLGKSTYTWFIYPLFCEVYICIYVYVRIYTYVYVIGAAEIRPGPWCVFLSVVKVTTYTLHSS